MRAARQYTAAELLGLVPRPKPKPPVRLQRSVTPRLDIAWGSFHQGIWSSVAAALSGPAARRPFDPGEFFKDAWVERRLPQRAIVAAALWHVAVFLLPWPKLPAGPRRNPAFENVELTWSGAINDLPLVDLPGPKAKPKPSPRAEPKKPLPPEGADGFHPRQRILTDPARPTHPRQTLIQPAAPPDAPKILPNLPNIVELGSSAVPARPRLQINQEALAKLHPRERRPATVTPADAPALADAATLTPQIGDVPLASSTNVPAKPKLQIDAGGAPRIANRVRAGDAAPTPEVNASPPGAAAGSSGMLIALSAAPAPPAPIVQVPQGNLAAHGSISPEGTQTGVPGGAENAAPGATGGAAGGPGSRGGKGTGSGGNSTAVSISGGNPGKSSGVSGLAGGPSKLRLSSAPPLSNRLDPGSQGDDVPVRSAPPNFTALPPGAKPEAIFGPKRVYTLYVNMPNLNSVTGSWILNFSELRTDVSGPRAAPSGELAGPVPLRKVDPKYPPTLINERVEGEVILYAVIRRDGSVDSIQLVRGIDERLDANAMQALAQWKFRPAARGGAPVELEAVVHIPFRFADQE